jgi:hypothetical protein
MSWHGFSFEKSATPEPFPWDGLLSIAILVSIGFVIWEFIGVATAFRFLIDPVHFGVLGFLAWWVFVLIAFASDD